jgi:hypothetical protein
VNKLVGLKLRMPFPRYEVLAKPNPKNDMQWEVQASAAGRPPTPGSIRTRYHPAPGRMDGDH